MDGGSDRPGTGEWPEDVARTWAAGMERSVRYDHRRWARRIAATLGSARGKVLVDLGSGPGFLPAELAPLLPGCRIIATDASPVMLRLAEERFRDRGLDIGLRRCSADAVPLPAATADVVTAKHLLRLLPDPDAMLAEVLRLLVPGGWFFLVDFDAEAPPWKARAMEAWLRLTGGRAFARIFRESYRDTALVARELPERLRRAGFAEARLAEEGLSFLLVARAPGRE